MSTGSIPSAPAHPRHQQASRSITERVSGSTKPMSSSSSHHHHHHHITAHISSSLHRRERSHDGHNGSMAAPPLVAPTTPRASLEAARSDGGTLSPDQSRRGSMLVTAGGTESLRIKQGGGPSREELLLKEARKTAARTAGFKNSLLDLTTFSATTTRHLDETYYNVLEKLTSLQNTIVALKDLAHASATSNDGFIAEAQGVLADAEAQLDAFGDFTEQQARVQALQDRVHGGRERIAALSARVDVVRQRVERWERADREWQETTRRRLKIMWGVLLGAGLVLLVLYCGARAYAGRMEGPVGGLQQEALEVKRKLAGKAAGVGLGKGEGRENGSRADVDFSRGGKAVQRAGDDALRALDEL